MSMGRKILRVAMPLLILAGGVGATFGLVSSRSAPEREAVVEKGAAVRVMTVEKGERKAVVSGTGTVRPAREVTVVPQVGGEVVSVSPSFVTGGFFSEGDLMFEIDPADYRLALSRAEAARASAEYELARIESQARVARDEWKRLGSEDENGEPNPLVLYEPQLKNARAALKSAEASVEQDRLDLERTRVVAPFDCRVRGESVDKGQYLTKGSPVAELAGTDTAEITVPLPLDELSWIDVPRTNGSGPGVTGSSAVVTVELGDEEHTWRGRVVRSVGEVDMKDRMMHVVVAVHDPYRLEDDGTGPALAVGTFVEVAIEGSTMEDVVVIPRSALRDGSTVWTVDGESELRIKDVEVARSTREEVVVSSGLKAGDRVVMTNLAGAADGMSLRVVGVEAGE